MLQAFLCFLISILVRNPGRRVLSLATKPAKILLAYLSKTMAVSMANIDAQANHDPEIYGVTIAFMLLALIAVILRFFTVFRLKNKKPALDDYMISVALVNLT